MDAKVKQEMLPLRSASNLQQSGFVSQPHKAATATLKTVINLDSSSSGSSGGSSSDSDESDTESHGVVKKRKLDNLDTVLPTGFLAPLAKAPSQTSPSPPVLTAVPVETRSPASFNAKGSRQFWRAGDFEGVPSVDWGSRPDGGDRMDHVRVHPKFLHSNATSHKWALGAFAELLDNALDEYSNGARYVNVDVTQSRKDRTKMLLIEDNGGGMDPERMRKCMSLGYSAKSKIANTIGQYGNGFKTSTMRLGADVIVFSRCPGKDGKSSTQSIGLLSYTFLRSTGKEDIVVPMLDYEYAKDKQEWNKIIRYSSDDWNRNVETIVQWSPFFNETDLLSQFDKMSDHGTRIIIYNLWEDDQGLLELDFDSDSHDIQLRGVNRDEKNIQMAKQFPNSRHFLTYRHSLRSYAAILYLRLPADFRIILRGKDVEHHNVVNDMMLSEKITYRPQYGADGVVKDNMTATVTVGFVKDAKHHIDIQGFNVYHKNRLIKPFWRLWNSASSQGRGVIGMLEANFVEPAHDKQGFERTTVLSRLEARLVQMQKNYWSKNCHHIGYASVQNKKLQNDSAGRESSPDYHPGSSSPAGEKYNASSSKVPLSNSGKRNQNGNASGKGNNRARTPLKFGERTVSSEEDVSDVDMNIGKKQRARSNHKASGSLKVSGKDGLHASRSFSCLDDIEPLQDLMPGEESVQPTTESMSKNLEKYDHTLAQPDLGTINHLKQENHELKERLEKWERESQCQLVLKCERCDSLDMQLMEVQQQVEELGKQRDDLLNVISEERIHRDEEEEKLRMKLKTASNTIQELLDKVKFLERTRSRNSKA